MIQRSQFLRLFWMFIPMFSYKIRNANYNVAVKTLHTCHHPCISMALMYHRSGMSSGTHSSHKQLTLCLYLNKSREKKLSHYIYKPYGLENNAKKRIKKRKKLINWPENFNIHMVPYPPAQPLKVILIFS